MSLGPLKSPRTKDARVWATASWPDVVSRGVDAEDATVLARFGAAPAPTLPGPAHNTRTTAIGAYRSAFVELGRIMADYVKRGHGVRARCWGAVRTSAPRIIAAVVGGRRALDSRSRSPRGISRCTVWSSDAGTGRTRRRGSPRYVTATDALGSTHDGYPCLISHRVAACVSLFVVGLGARSGMPPVADTRMQASAHLLRHGSSAHARPGADRALTAAHVELGPYASDMRLAGALGAGTTVHVASLLAAHPGVVRIHLTSEGGLVSEGLALGALVAARGLATYVPDYCVSACTLVFVRGSRRYLRTGGRLGFHAPYGVDVHDRAHPVDAAPERRAYLAAGIGVGFVARALAVPPTGIWIPGTRELLNAKVVTRIVDAGRFPISTHDDGRPAIRASVPHANPTLPSRTWNALGRFAK